MTTLSMKKVASQCQAAFTTHKAIFGTKQQTARLNPAFGSSTDELIDGLTSGNEFAMAELYRRAQTHDQTVEEFLTEKMARRARSAERKAKAAQPKAAAVPVSTSPLMAGLSPEIQALIAALLQTSAPQASVATAPAEVTVPAATVKRVIDPVLRKNCIKAGIDAMAAQDREALKAELITLGVVDKSCKLRFKQLAELFEKKYKVNITKHSAPASTPQVLKPVDMAIGDVQFEA